MELNGAKILYTIHTNIPVLGDLKITHMAAVQTAVPQVMRSSSFLDSGCNFIANPPTFIDAS